MSAISKDLSPFLDGCGHELLLLENIDDTIQCTAESRDLAESIMAHIPYIPDPERFMLILPSLFVHCSDETVARYVDTLLVLMNDDSKLITSVIYALNEMIIPKSIKMNLHARIIDSISIVCESDLPSIIRFALALVDSDSSSNLPRIRSEVTRIRERNMHVLVEILFELLPINPRLFDLWLVAMENGVESERISLADFVVICLLYGEHLNYAPRLQVLALRWFCSKMLPFDAMVNFCKEYTGDCYSPVISSCWKVLYWLISVGIDSVDSDNYMEISNVVALTSCILELCSPPSSMSWLKKSIICSLVESCFHCNALAYDQLPQVGCSFNLATLRKSSSHAPTSKNAVLCVIQGIIDICLCSEEIGFHLFNYIANKLHVIDTPRIPNRVIRLLAVCSEKCKPVEEKLLILIQKLSSTRLSSFADGENILSCMLATIYYPSQKCISNAYIADRSINIILLYANLVKELMIRGGIDGNRFALLQKELIRSFQYVPVCCLDIVGEAVSSVIAWESQERIHKLHIESISTCFKDTIISKCLFLRNWFRDDCAIYGWQINQITYRFDTTLNSILEFLIQDTSLCANKCLLLATEFSRSLRSITLLLLFTARTISSMEPENRQYISSQLALECEGRLYDESNIAISPDWLVVNDNTTFYSINPSVFCWCSGFTLDSLDVEVADIDSEATFNELLLLKQAWEWLWISAIFLGNLTGKSNKICALLIVIGQLYKSRYYALTAKAIVNWRAKFKKTTLHSKYILNVCLEQISALRQLHTDLFASNVGVTDMVEMLWSLLAPTASEPNDEFQITDVLPTPVSLAKFFSSCGLVVSIHLAKYFSLAFFNDSQSIECKIIHILMRLLLSLPLLAQLSYRKSAVEPENFMECCIILFLSVCNLLRNAVSCGAFRKAAFDSICSLYVHQLSKSDSTLGALCASELDFTGISTNQYFVYIVRVIIQHSATHTSNSTIAAAALSTLFHLENAFGMSAEIGFYPHLALRLMQSFLPDQSIIVPGKQDHFQRNALKFISQERRKLDEEEVELLFCGLSLHQFLEALEKQYLQANASPDSVKVVKVSIAMLTEICNQFYISPEWESHMHQMHLHILSILVWWQGSNHSIDEKFAMLFINIKAAKGYILARDSHALPEKNKQSFPAFNPQTCDVGIDFMLSLITLLLLECIQISSKEDGTFAMLKRSICFLNKNWDVVNRRVIRQCSFDILRRYCRQQVCILIALRLCIEARFLWVEQISKKSIAFQGVADVRRSFIELTAICANYLTNIDSFLGGVFHLHHSTVAQRKYIEKATHSLLTAKDQLKLTLASQVGIFDAQTELIIPSDDAMFSEFSDVENYPTIADFLFTKFPVDSEKTHYKRRRTEISPHGNGTRYQAVPDNGNAILPGIGWNLYG